MATNTSPRTPDEQPDWTAFQHTDASWQQRERRVADRARGKRRLALATVSAGLAGVVVTGYAVTAATASAGTSSAGSSAGSTNGSGSTGATDSTGQDDSGAQLGQQDDGSSSSTSSSGSWVSPGTTVQGTQQQPMARSGGS